MPSLLTAYRFCSNVVSEMKEGQHPNVTHGPQPVALAKAIPGQKTNPDFSSPLTEALHVFLKENYQTEAV